MVFEFVVIFGQMEEQLLSLAFLVAANGATKIETLIRLGQLFGKVNGGNVPDERPRVWNSPQADVAVATSFRSWFDFGWNKRK